MAEAMAILRETLDVLEMPVLDVLHEEDDVGTCDEGLARAREHDAAHLRIGDRLLEPLAQLLRDLGVERVHGVGTIDGEGGDAVLRLRPHEVNRERRAELHLLAKERRRLELVTLLERAREPERLVDADPIHQLERPLRPAQADARADVGVLDRADPFAHQLRRDVKGHAEQSIANRGEALRLGFTLERKRALGLDVLVDLARRRVEGAEMLGQALRRVKADRDTGHVHQLEGTHADLERVLGRRLDRRNVGDSLFEQPRRFVDPRHEEAIDDEAGLVAAPNRRLADALLQRPQAREQILRRARSADDLDQPVLRRMVEVVEPDHPLRMRHALRDVLHVERRRVRREHGIGPHVLRQQREDRALDPEVLEDRFDREVGLLQSLPIEQRRDPRRDRLRLRLLVDLPLHRFFERGLDPRHAGRHRRLIEVDQEDGKALGGVLLRDA